MSMHEGNEAAKVGTESADPNAKIIFGSVINEDFGDEVKITVVATGFGKKTPTRRESFYAPATTTAPTNHRMSAPVPEPEEEYVVQRAEEEERLRMQQKAAGEDRRTASRTATAVQSDDELDIPAFIRKKML